MFSLLPDHTPRDFLSYTSPRGPAPQAVPDPSALDPSQPPATSRRQNQEALERTAAARLRADEAYQERRRLNVSNFGATWLRPPGVAKTLFQLREERREQEEHAEALRREAALAMQLADAEAAAADGADGAPGGEPMDADADAGAGDGGGERDLDDEIPDAEGFGFDGADSDDGDAAAGEEDAGPEPEPEPAQAGFRAVNAAAAANRTRQQQLRQMRATEDEAAVAAARGWREYYREDDDDFLEEEDQAELLEEEDLAPEPRGAGSAGDGADLDMDADLDDDIPEADDGEGYEHTDSEASLSSDDVSPQQQFMRRAHPGLARVSGGPADLLSSGSSALGSSPHGRSRRS